MSLKFITITILACFNFAPSIVLASTISEQGVMPSTESFAPVMSMAIGLGILILVLMIKLKPQRYKSSNA